MPWHKKTQVKNPLKYKKSSKQLIHISKNVQKINRDIKKMLKIHIKKYAK